MGNIQEKLDEIRQMIQNPDFIAGRGLSNEVNIHILSYDPKDEMKIRHFVKQMHKDHTLKCNLIECNLYEKLLEICDVRHIVKAIPNMEKNKGKEYLKSQLNKVAGVDAFIKAIQYAPHGEKDVLLITGIGSVFPFMRVHALLNAMQPHFSDVAILALYPGEYDGRMVRLFGEMKANPYYRAFNLS